MKKMVPIHEGEKTIWINPDLVFAVQQQVEPNAVRIYSSTMSNYIVLDSTMDAVVEAIEREWEDRSKR